MSSHAVRVVRLGTGLILLTYLTTHFLNHALGIVSLAAMESGRVWFLLLWRHPVAAGALYGALVTHALLGLWALYRRRTLRMPAWEATQLVLGLTIPPLLTAHVVGNRLAHDFYGIDDSYARVLLVFWVASPWRGAFQTALVLIAWIHGCMGIHFWLRFRPWYPRSAVWLVGIAVAVPVLALAGFVQGGIEVTELARSPGWVATVTPRDTPTTRATLTGLAENIVAVYGALLALTLAARGARAAYLWRWRSVSLTYPSGRVVTVPIGFTVLEASRYAGLPHAAVCGGRGRCSTCRVRIARGLDTLPPARDAERRVLRRIGAPPDVRLACQLRPVHSTEVVPLLAARDALATVLGHERQGVEQEIVVVFADLRGFTRMAEKRLPYDVVYLLNRYFEAVGSAIERAGGIANQFTGDGVMALFGVESGPEAGCRQALVAARAMIVRVDSLSRELSGELPQPLRLGIGIHVGHAVVGRMGYGDSTYFTAVGDTVHVAARLEQATKDYGCELVISEDVVTRAGVDVGAFPRHEVTLRNRATPVIVRIIERVASLPAASVPGEAR
ncbi:MAG: adenylate/guanylate cyclase domain-containing protein [Candidatus Rokuibacteriota bacterium]|nr:MAG: adenylate/guanylate cyclase domain-containing protein [Candidatus Rokubacteria bacterium]